MLLTDTKQFPILALFPTSNTKRSETTLGKVGTGLPVFGYCVLVKSLEPEDTVGSSLGTCIHSAVLFNLGSDSLGDRVKRKESSGMPSALQFFLSSWVVLGE